MKVFRLGINGTNDIELPDGTFIEAALYGLDIDLYKVDYDAERDAEYAVVPAEHCLRQVSWAPTSNGAYVEQSLKFWLPYSTEEKRTLEFNVRDKFNSPAEDVDIEAYYSAQRRAELLGWGKVEITRLNVQVDPSGLKIFKYRMFEV